MLEDFLTRLREYLNPTPRLDGIDAHAGTPTPDGRRLLLAASEYELHDISAKEYVPAHRFATYEDALAYLVAGLDPAAAAPRVYVSPDGTAIVCEPEFGRERPVVIEVAHAFAPESEEWARAIFGSPSETRPARLDQAALHRLLLIEPGAVESDIAQKLLAIASRIEQSGSTVTTSERDQIGGRVAVAQRSGQTIEVTIPPSFDVRLRIESPLAADARMPVIFQIHSGRFVIESIRDPRRVLAAVAAHAAEEVFRTRFPQAVVASGSPSWIPRTHHS